MDSGKSRANRLNCSADRPVAETHRKNDNNRNIEAGKILLKLQPSISGQQDVEVILCAPEKLTIRIARPTLFLNRPNCKLGQVTPKLSWQVLVKQYASQAMRASSARPASSRNAMACSRETLGKSSRNSSIVSPPSR